MGEKKINGGFHTYVIPAGNPPSTIEMEQQGDFIQPKTVKQGADPVNRPAHYTQGQIECADFIDDQQLPHHEASAIEYIVRARFKGKEVQDLQKAVWHLNRRIQLLEKTNAGK